MQHAQHNNIHTHTHIYIHTHTHTHTRTREHTHTHTHTRRHEHRAREREGAREGYSELAHRELSWRRWRLQAVRSRRWGSQQRTWNDALLRYAPYAWYGSMARSRLPHTRPPLPHTPRRVIRARPRALPTHLEVCCLAHSLRHEASKRENGAQRHRELTARGEEANVCVGVWHADRKTWLDWLGRCRMPLPQPSAWLAA